MLSRFLFRRGTSTSSTHGLLQLTLDRCGAAKLRLDARVRKVYPGSRKVELDDGSTYFADLTVTTDGLHSIIRGMVIGSEQAMPTTSQDALRFLLPTALVLQNLELSKLLEFEVPGKSIIADTEDPVHERHMVWYGR